MSPKITWMIDLCLCIIVNLLLIVAILIMAIVILCLLEGLLL